MAAKSTKTEKKEFPILERSFELNRANFDKEKRTIRVQFASETPVRRYIPSFGIGDEILDCSAKSIDLSRLNSGAAVLMEHDPSQRCGITESGNVTAQRTAEAIVRFARTPAGDSAMAEVEDGTLRWISVGYRVDNFEVDDNEEEYRATRWTPFEVSFVAIPADPAARVLRSNENKYPVMITRSIRLDPSPKDPAGGAVADPPELDEEGNPIVSDANERNAEMESEIRETFAMAHKWEPTYSGLVEFADDLVKGGKRMLEGIQKEVFRRMAEKPPEKMWGAIAKDGKRKQPTSLGEAFVQSELYRKFGAKQGEKRQIICRLDDELKFRTTFSATTEALTSIQKLPGVPGILDQQMLMVADLFSQGTTNALTVRYIQEDSYTQAATAVAEAGTKPEATLNVSEVDATVRKIAVWTKVTDEMLADFEQMSSYINSRLGYMVQALEDNHLLNGTGSNNQIKGVLLFSGIQTVSGATNPLDGVLKAISYVRGANGAGFGEPTAIVMHPKDWMNAKLTKDQNLQYYGGGPFSGIYGAGMYSNVYNMWGLPCVVTTSIAQGTALVGDFRTGAQIFRKKGLTIESTNSNEDDFKNNLVMLRAEERLALAVYQPAKFCTVTGIPSV